MTSPALAVSPSASARKPARFESLVTKYRVPLLDPRALPAAVAAAVEALAVNVLIYGTVAVGYNLLFGYTGLLSFGHAAFVGTRAYITGIAIGQFGVPWYLAVLMGVIGGALLAFVMGALSTRTRGIYCSMVTLALAQLVYYVALQTPSWTELARTGCAVSPSTRSTCSASTSIFLDPVNKYYVLMAFAARRWLVSRILNSPFGAAIEAIRENERRARTCGYNVERTKLFVVYTCQARSRLAALCSALHLALRAAGFAALSILRHDRDDDCCWAAPAASSARSSVHWCSW